MSGTNKITRPQALARLYNASTMGRFSFVPGDMTENEAAGLLERQDYFDYLKGRVMKVNVKDLIKEDGSIDESELRLYDRDNGPGAGVRALKGCQ